MIDLLQHLAEGVVHPAIFAAVCAIGLAEADDRHHGRDHQHDEILPRHENLLPMWPTRSRPVRFIRRTASKFCPPVHSTDLVRNAPAGHLSGHFDAGGFRRGPWQRIIRGLGAPPASRVAAGARLFQATFGNDFFRDRAMKDTLKIGDRGESSHRVVSAELVSHYDPAGPPVFGSPFMLMLMEIAAFNALLPHLDAGEQSRRCRLRVRAPGRHARRRDGDRSCRGTGH